MDFSGFFRIVVDDGADDILIDSSVPLHCNLLCCQLIVGSAGHSCTLRRAERKKPQDDITREREGVRLSWSVITLYCGETEIMMTHNGDEKPSYSMLSCRQHKLTRDF